MSGLRGQIVFFPEREVILPFRPVCHSLDGYYSRDHAVCVGAGRGGSTSAEDLGPLLVFEFCLKGSGREDVFLSERTQTV